MSAPPVRYDALIVGSGIGGLQAALDLADQGSKVAVVEREASTGGAMIKLSKVFPTLDCSSCITTPKMAAVHHHPNIDTYTMTELLSLAYEKGVWNAKLREYPRYVDADLCIGCRLCEYACPIEIPDDYQGGLSGKRTISIPFSNAIPQIAVLDADSCILCGRCADVCPKECILFDQKPRDWRIAATTTILATGWSLTPITAKKEYNAETLANVISPMQMERLLAPHGPFGRVIRPADGKMPDSVAFVQCAGSRDESIGVPYCSRVCCMYAIKQAMLLSGAVPLADITIYYMDIRAFGKGYDEFYQRAKAMGIEFVKAKVARITEGENRDVILRIENQDASGQVEEKVHDLVILSLGMLPGADVNRLAGVEVGEDGFAEIPQPHIHPCRTGKDGLLVAGTAIGPKDIVDTILEAGAAAMDVSLYIKDHDGNAPGDTGPGAATGGE